MNIVLDCQNKKKNENENTGFANAPSTWLKLIKAVLLALILTQLNLYQELLTLRIGCYVLEVVLKPQLKSNIRRLHLQSFS